MRRFRSLTMLPLIAVLALPAAALAQQAVPGGGKLNHPGQPGQPGQPAPQPSNRPPMPIIDVDFAGGTVGEFVKVVQKAAMESAAKTPINVMVPAESSQVALPAISLKRISAETALETLRYAFGTQGLHQFEARNMTNDGDEGLTFAIQYSPGRMSPQMQGMMPMQPIQSEAYSLRDLTTTPAGLAQNDPGLSMSADTVLAALKLAAELESTDNRVEPTQLLFHPDTQLLIARGTPDQHRLIASVLAQLNDTLSQRREQADDDQARVRNNELQQLELEAHIQAARSQMDRSISELAPAQAELDRVEKLVESGNVSMADLERARANFQVAKTNANAAEAQYSMSIKRRAIMEKASGGSRSAAVPSEIIVVIYDLRDLSNFKTDFYNLVKTVIKPDGQMSVKPAAGDPTGSVVVHATRPQHEILVSIFNTARRLKTNEPKLPGTTLDALIEQSKE